MSWDIYDDDEQAKADEVARQERAQRRVAEQKKPGRSLADRVPLRPTAIVVLILVAVVIGWLIFGGSGHKNNNSSISHPGSGAGGTAPVALSASGLQTLVAALKQPVYWIGPKTGTTYEFRQLSNGNAYIRYLPTGTAAGDTNTYVTVGTYPVANAYTVVHGLATAAGADRIKVPGSAVAFAPSSNATDAYVAFPGSDYQIEVYSPTPGAARQFVAHGSVALVPGSSAGPVGVAATSPSKLQQLATSLGQPIYWASSEAGRTLEVRQTSQGYVYVRYLPRGVAVGDRRAFRSIATYPLANAFAVTKALGQKAGETTISLPGGGIGVYAKQKGSKDAYVAFPNENFQVEVFDPTAGAARALVAAHKISALH